MDAVRVTPQVGESGGYAAELGRRISTREATVAVVGLGYVGLPLAVQYAEAGFPVIGLDTDRAKVAEVNAGRSYIQDVAARDVAEAVRAERLRATADPAVLADADLIFICVPTPMTRHKEPDVSYIEQAAEGVAEAWRPGQLVVLRSTSYPGTTDEIVRPALESRGAVIGGDTFVAFAPERVDPGRTDPPARKIPVVVGGCDPESARLAALALGAVADQVVTVSSPAAAEMTKLLENVFRNVNIALVNQLAMLCERMGLDVWEIIEAAATKPYGFMKFTPGLVGGHCIPVDPYYLAWKAREHDFHFDFIELAAKINEDMPHYVAQRVMLAINGDPSRKVLVLGVAFKKDVADARQSAAARLVEILQKHGLDVAYHDPYVPALCVNSTVLHSELLTEDLLREVACVVIATDHSTVPYQWVLQHARRVFDVRGIAAGRADPDGRVVRL